MARRLSLSSHSIKFSVLRAGAACALVLPDRGERYLDTIYCDTWVGEKIGDIHHLWREERPQDA